MINWGKCYKIDYNVLEKLITFYIISLGGDAVAKDAAQITQTRDYHLPAAFENYNLDINDDSVIAVNYTVRTS